MKKLMLAIAAVTLMTVPAVADVLWDQYAPDPSVGAANDFDAGCGFGTTHLHANDVSFDEAVTITDIRTVYDYYNDAGIDLISLTTEAYLMIIPKDGTLVWSADTDPRNFPTVPVTVTIVEIDGVEYQELHASGLNITLDLGEWWVAFNPIALAPGGLSNQHFIATTQVGSGLMYGTACAGGPWYEAADLFGSPVDSTLLLEGSLATVATEDSSWGQLKALYR